jgi:hypothetical protein
MSWTKWLVGCLLLAALAVQAESARIVKVLPQFLDHKGHHALQPSLYERDAYQAHLRKHPDLISALRFEVQWKASGLSGLTLRVETRGSKEGQPTQATVEVPVKRKGWLGHWTMATIGGDTYRGLGRMTAWRATLWSAGRQVAEQKSFLW